VEVEMQKKTSQRNRGKYLEALIERSNIQYDLKGIATINKIPTPMTTGAEMERYLMPGTPRNQQSTLSAFTMENLSHLIQSRHH